MHRTLVLVVLTTWTVSLGAGPARASELHSIRNSKVYGGDPQEVARAFLSDRTASFDLATVDLVSRQTLASGDLRTVRFSQVHRGLLVLGTGAAVRVSPAGRVTVVALEVARDLTVSVTPTVGHAAVRTLLHSLVGPWAANGPLRFLLAVLPERDGPGRLVWQVDLRTADGGLRYLIDAHRGVLLFARSLATHTLGRVYPISSAVTPDATDLELVDLDDASPLVLTGWGGQLTVTNYVSGGSQSTIVAEQTLQTSDGSNFLYDPPTDPTDPTDAFAQVGLYYHLTRMRSFFSAELGIDFSQPEYAMTAVANMMEDGAPMDNAYYSEQGMGDPWNTPNLIAIGQGTTLDFADDSDVFLHEFTHYVSHVAVGYNMGQLAINQYGISPFSGALDEGLADYFACTVNGDPLMGEASLVPQGAGRDLTNTSKVCPDDVFGEVHMDGELIGSIAWTLHEDFGKAAADQLIWGAMTLLLPYATFGDFSQALLQTAGEMVTAGQLVAADVQTLQDALDARGLTDCFQEISIEPGSTRTLNMFGLDLIGQVMGADCAGARGYGLELSSLFHLRATPGVDDEGIRLTVEVTPETAGELQWKIYARAGDNVTFSSGGFFPTVSAFDYESDWFDSTDGELLINADSNPAFDPTQTYHYVIVHQSCPNTRGVASVGPAPATETPDAGVDAGPDAGPDAAVSADASEPDRTPTGGCGCRSTGSGGAVPLLLLLVLGLVRRRRF